MAAGPLLELPLMQLLEVLGQGVSGALVLTTQLTAVGQLLTST
jgi:hypothetical protein